MNITKAFVLGAGKGTRMRPLTDHCPKPLIKLNGKTMLDRQLDALRAVGVNDIVVNTHYLADQMAAHLQDQKDVTISHETDVLETGGGLRHAVAHFNGEPFYVLTSDIMWSDGAENTLQRLARYWNDAQMDFLLLLNKKLPDARGDFVLQGDVGRPVHRDSTAETPNTTYMGISIIHPRLIEQFAEGHFPIRELIFKAQQDERLFAMLHDGERFSVGTPEAFAAFDKLFTERGL